MQNKINYFNSFLGEEDYITLLKIINNIEWNSIGIDTEGDNYSTHFTHTLINSKNGIEINNNELLNKILFKINKFYKKKYLPHNLYVNYSKYGDDIRIHTDRITNKKNKTFILYCTNSWDVNWHGDLIFYDKDFNIIGGMLPYPNSAVCFDSNILHTVKPLSRDCKVGRKALVFQLEEI
jgi:hypothetical protein